MSMLLRNRKEKGFHQLVTMLETATQERREHLMGVYQSEDPGWAALLRTKVLTIDRIFSWAPEFVQRFALQLEPRALALVLSSLPDEARQRAIQTLEPSPAFEKDLINFLSGLEEYQPGERDAACVKLVMLVRDLERQGKINLSEIDPALSAQDTRSGA